MNSKNGYLLYVIAFIAFFFIARVSQAWNSCWTYTHEKIADEAINAITESEYADIHKFAEELRDGSETESSHNPPGDDYHFQVWSPTSSLWWNRQDDDGKGALLWYNEYNVHQAYLRIGYILHLKQDKYVPAHMAVCAHGYGGRWVIVHSQPNVHFLPVK
jgi:hypothetical protein